MILHFNAVLFQNDVCLNLINCTAAPQSFHLFNEIANRYHREYAHRCIEGANQWPPFGTNFPKRDSILSNQWHIFKSPRQTGANLNMGIPGFLPD